VRTRVAEPLPGLPVFGHFGLRNVGEHRARLIDELNPVSSLFRGQHAWSCQGFLGGPAKILNDLYLAPFTFPGKLFGDDGDNVPYTMQIVFPILCED
jgi:hypothetical protein